MNLEFYNMIADLGENIIFFKDGEVIQQRMSIKTAKNNFSAEGSYLKSGVMTFDNLKQQDELLGEYFAKESNEEIVNILSIVNNEPNCDGMVGEIYCTECNEQVDLISHYTTIQDDEFGDEILTPVYIDKNVNAFVKTSIREQLDTNVGSFIENTTIIVLPAKYKLSVDNIVVRKTFVFNNTTKQNEYIDVKYKVESVDTTMVKKTQNGEFKGVVKCLITENKE